MTKPFETWLITDTHFYHRTVVEIGNRPENHGELMLKWLRHYVRLQDVLIHLGDVIFRQHHKLHELLSSVHCRTKILIRGNHDRKSNNWYLNNGFDVVCNMMVLEHVLLSHKPQEHLPDGVTINIHGHFHDTDHRKNEPEFTRFLNPTVHKLLAMEYVDYKPVKLFDFAKI